VDHERYGLEEGGDLPAGLVQEVCGHVRALCDAGPDRNPGSIGNEVAVEYVSEALRGSGARVELLTFEVPAWEAGGAYALTPDGRTIDLRPGPFSAGTHVTGVLVNARSAAEISAACRPGCVLLLSGAIAGIQLTPRGYPWYSDPDHDAIYNAIESLQPAAVIAATGKNPSMTAAMSPFPLIEDPSFPIPHAYTDLDAGACLSALVGQAITVVIESDVRPTTGSQPVARFRGDDSARRVIVAGHMDSKWGTPGAVDNAAGASVALAVATLIGDTRPRMDVEIVPFNGEDHATCPGEVAYVNSNAQGFDDVELMINIDAPGLVGSSTAVSLYGVDGAAGRAVSEAFDARPEIQRGPEWFASDHAIFAMRGVPSIAVTCSDFDRLALDVAHTPADTIDRVDCTELARVALFVRKVIEGLA